MSGALQCVAPDLSVRVKRGNLFDEQIATLYSKV